MRKAPSDVNQARTAGPNIDRYSSPDQAPSSALSPGSRRRTYASMKYLDASPMAHSVMASSSSPPPHGATTIFTSNPAILNPRPMKLTLPTYPRPPSKQSQKLAHVLMP